MLRVNRILSVTFVAIGVALLVETAILGGGQVGFVAVQSPDDEADQNGDGTVCQQDIGIPNVVGVTVSLDN